ncbi:MAG: OmpA family protein [Candidatus Latescibacterota bacterium]|nr:MAG: OmpA family protein [Candidatus Latescibacterota bacterium]
MRRNGMVGVLLVGVVALGGAGCATRGYVRDEVRKEITTLRGDMGRSDEVLQRGVDDAGLVASRAELRAEAAEHGLGSVRDLALGNSEFKEVGRHRVYFDFDSAELEGEAVQTLDAVARDAGSNLRACVELFGFADPVGADWYNVSLGERRADAVRRYLVESGSVPLTRIETMSFGETWPAREKPAGGDHAQLRQVLVVLVERVEASSTEEEKILSQK